MGKHPLKSFVEAQKNGIPAGIYSACTVNDLVIEAVMERALKDNNFILIEATANQVNQYGGYTGMKPADFSNVINTTKTISEINFLEIAFCYKPRFFPAKLI